MGKCVMTLDLGKVLNKNGDLNPTAKQIKPDIIAESDERFGRLFDEVSRDEAPSQESSDEESVNWDSVRLHNNLESLCSKQTAAKNGSSFEGNQTTSTYNAMEREKPKSPSNEDATTQIGNVSQAPGSVEEMTTLVDSNECKAIKHDNKVQKTKLVHSLETNSLYDRISQQTNIESEQDHVSNQAEYSDGARETKITKPEDESNEECDDRIRLNPLAPQQLLPLYFDTIFFEYAENSTLSVYSDLAGPNQSKRREHKP